MARGALARCRVRRLRADAHLRTVRCRRLRRARARRRHAVHGPGHQASRRLLLLGLRAHRSHVDARRAAARRDRGARGRVRTRGDSLRALLLAARLVAPRLSRCRRVRRCLHAAADSRAGGAVRAVDPVERRALGSSTVPLALGRDRLRVLRGDGATRSRGSGERPFLGLPRRLHGVRVRRARPSARPSVGVVPWPLVLLLRQPGRGAGRPSRWCGRRRDARRDGRQGRSPAAQRRTQCRRHDPRDPIARVARRRRVGQRARRGRARLAAVRRAR